MNRAWLLLACFLFAACAAAESITCDQIDINGVCCMDGVLGCDRICNSGLVEDACGICNGRNATLDHAGVCCNATLDADRVCCGGTMDRDGRCCAAELDADGVCCAASQRGCDGKCFGPQNDHCGVCGGDNRSCCGADGRCGGHGACLSEFRTCKCDVGWTGAGCTISQHTCDGVSCGPHGLCVEENGVPVCSCDDRWTGAHCELSRCATRGVYDKESGLCACLHPYDGAAQCESCLPPREGRTRVCVRMPHATIVRAEPTLAAKVLLAKQNVTMGGAPVRVFAPDSEFEGVQYDCGCRPVAVAGPGARYTIQAADAALSQLLSQEVSFLVQSNAELQELTDKRIASFNRELFYPPFIAFAGFALFALFAGLLAAMYAVISQRIDLKRVIQLATRRNPRDNV